MTESEQADAKSLNLYQKLNRIMAEVGKIEKTGRNDTQKYNFIEQSVVMAKLRPLFAQYGVVLIPAITHTEFRKLVSARGNENSIAQCDMAFALINADNPADRLEGIPWSAEGGDTGDKGVNKAGTSGTKYFLMKLLMISEKDDPDAETIPDQGTAKKATADGWTAGLRDDVQREQQARATVAEINALLAVDATAKEKLPKPVAEMTTDELDKTLSWLKSRRQRAQV